MKIEKNKWKKNLFSVLNDNFINFSVVLIRIFDALYFTIFMNRTFILKKKKISSSLEMVRLVGYIYGDMEECPRKCVEALVDLLRRK